MSGSVEALKQGDERDVALTSGRLYCGRAEDE
jgi:hypothetical protein